MTQLDRLEALAEKWQKRGLLPQEIEITLNTLPDLIRVARATHKHLATGRHGVTDELETALSPLFAEVES